MLYHKYSTILYIIRVLMLGYYMMLYYIRQSSLRLIRRLFQGPP